jgi:hypothetical protein
MSQALTIRVVPPSRMFLGGVCIPTATVQERKCVLKRRVYARDDSDVG